MNEVLKEKIGQMILIGFNGLSVTQQHPVVQAILKKQIGGVILFDYDIKTKNPYRNIQNPEQLKKLTADLQKYGNHSLFIGVDYEGGAVNRLKEKNGFSHTQPAAKIATLSFTEIKKYANSMAQTLADVGINLNFAPLLDVNINPDNPILGQLKRCFSNDPQHVSDCAYLFYEAFSKQNIFSTYKHFPGHGSSTGDSHLSCVDVTETWEWKELLPYQDLFQKSSKIMVMTAHIVHRILDPTGLPASLSFQMIQQLLREKLHFQGVVITDDLQMQAISRHYSFSDSIRLAIQAGADILLVSNQLGEREIFPEEIIFCIQEHIYNGLIPIERIEESYQRIMQLKNSFL